jgi:hypothetical protein
MRRQTGGDAGGLGRGGQKAGLKEAFDAEIVAEIGEGREGKQADGSSKTREVKLLTIWTAEVRDEEGTPVRDPGSVSDSAAIESAAQKDTDAVPSEFAARVQREATRRGFDRAQRRVVLGDGAPWIWKLAGEQFPDAIQVLDLFHAKGHLWDVAKAIYGAGSDLGKQWAKSGGTSSTRARSTRSSRRCACTPRPTTRRVSAWATSPTTATGCATSSFAPRLYHVDRSRRGWLQGRDQHAAQAQRHALDRRRGRRDHRPALLKAFQPLRGLLGAPVSGRDGSRRVRSSYKSVVRPLLRSTSARAVSICRWSSLSSRDFWLYSLPAWEVAVAICLRRTSASRAF